jgi:hypothetical protein
VEVSNVRFTGWLQMRQRIRVPEFMPMSSIFGVRVQAD